MQDNQSILYLSYDGILDPLGQSQIMPYLYGLSEKEYEISVISYEKSRREELREKNDAHPASERKES